MSEALDELLAILKRVEISSPRPRRVFHLWVTNWLRPDQYLILDTAKTCIAPRDVGRGELPANALCVCMDVKGRERSRQFVAHAFPWLRGIPIALDLFIAEAYIDREVQRRPELNQIWGWKNAVQTSAAPAAEPCDSLSPHGHTTSASAGSAD